MSDLQSGALIAVGLVVLALAFGAGTGVPPEYPGALAAWLGFGALVGGGLIALAVLA